MPLTRTGQSRPLPGWLPYAVGALLVTLLIAAATGLALSREAERQKRDVATSTQNLTLLLAEQVGGLFAQADGLLKSTINFRNDALRHGGLERSRFNAFLASELSQLPAAQNLRVLDADGILRYGNDALVDVSFADREYFTRARDDAAAGLIIVGPLLGRVTNQPLLFLSRRLENLDGSFAGVAYVVLTLNSLDAVFARIEIGPAGAIALRRLDMALVTRYPHLKRGDPGSEQPNKVSQALLDLVEKQPEAGTYEAVSPSDQTHRVYSYRRLAGYPFLAFVGRASSDYLAEWRDNALLLFLLGGTMVAVTGLAARQLYRSARRLRAGEARWRLALESGAQGVWEADLATRTIYWSPRVRQMLGQGDAPGPASDTALERLHPDDLGDLQTRIDALLAGEIPSFAAEYRLRRDDGSYLWVESHGMISERRRDGQPARLIGTYTDIGERKENERRLAESLHLLEERNRELAAQRAQLDQAHAALQVSEERYQLASQASRDGIWDWSLQGDGSFINPAYGAMLGYAPGELGNAPAEHFAALLHPDDSARVLASTRDLLADSGGFELEFRMRCKDGSYKWILSRGKLVERDAAGRPLRAVGTHVDITDRKLYEIHLAEAKEAAEAASRAKSTFLANMSHELRTPMNGIMGMTALALNGTQDPRLRDQLGKIDKASRHLLNVINDILDISKIEADRLTLEEVDFTLGDLRERVATLLAPRAEEKGIDFAFAQEAAIDALAVRGDPMHLAQILLNLAGNAVKFTESGSVTVRSERLAADDDEVRLYYEVVDTGIGIAPEVLPRLFTAFEQADNSMTRKFGGTGLGLAISQRLVRMMGGEIGVSSEPGRGSSFWFTVRLGKAAHTPDSASQPADGAAEARLRERFTGTRLLLAEDEPINQEVSRALLEDAGFVVDLAEDGAQAVELARHQQYPLVLLDIQMPKLNGLDAARAIRQLPGYATTPILAMSASVFERERLACQAAGMNDHIGKPVTPEVVFTTLLRWLDKAPSAAGDKPA